MKPTICVSMIIKNEAPVLKRCLDSLSPFVDQFVIVDTGSTDNTREVLALYPNVILHERPWKNFGENRQQALEMARLMGWCDYILFMDADDTLNTINPNFHWPDLTLPGYKLPIHYGDTRYSRCCLVRADAPWRWEGVVHEYLDSPVALQQGELTDPFIVVHHDGARSKNPHTYRKDAALLEMADPTPRNVFYLAQSYRDAGMSDDALKTYLRRAAMGGWEEEAWFASYEAAKLKEALNQPPHEVTGAYLDCYQRRPTRAEPLFHLSRYHRCRNEFHLAYLVSSRGAKIALSSDVLFVNASVYEWRLLEELALSAYYVGEVNEGKLILEALVQRQIPEADKQRMVENLRWYK